MAYSIREHKHCFAAWAASTAARSGTRIKGATGLTGERGRAILDHLGFFELVDRPDLLPSAVELDGAHRDWRGRAIECAVRFNLALTHGVAAKLINVYMKSAFVCGGFASHPNVCALHPPIDKLLLDELCRQDVGGCAKRWGAYSLAAWSKFDSPAYESVIHQLRVVQRDCPLWMVEQHWRGFQ